MLTTINPNLSNKIEYRAFDKANNVNTILKLTVKEKLHGNWLSLSGNYSDEGGFEIYNSFSEMFTQSYFGAFVKAQTTVANTNWAKTASKVVIKRINGISYYIQSFISIIVIAIIFIISTIEFLKTGKLLRYEWHVLPIFLVIYLLFIELWAILSFKKLASKIIELITENGIEVNEL